MAKAYECDVCGKLNSGIQSVVLNLKINTFRNDVVAEDQYELCSSCRNEITKVFMGDR